MAMATHATVRTTSTPVSSARETSLSVTRWRIALSTKRGFPILLSPFLCQLEQRRRLLRGYDRGEMTTKFRQRRHPARAGLPVVSSIPVLGPVLNAVFNPVVLFIIYAAGASRFWSGFGRTTYTNSVPTKIALTGLWPALFIVSAAYRSNFKKAVL